ncbi:Hypothetical_protein [Hexamita inflata]|uniref:Hypothetical_protein n=1 Tax=Hexamita inflata TaxID=28002 RepID=A0AA86UPC3_9EUKA|nr:Hypothetical protein HINF_LOCUS46786 [Hexamita inflata]CAI9959142.1 Hypothetical protein HINF_LOCUS46787 [Hexamita inflata]
MIHDISKFANSGWKPCLELCLVSAPARNGYTEITTLHGSGEKYAVFQRIPAQFRDLVFGQIQQIFKFLQFFCWRQMEQIIVKNCTNSHTQIPAPGKQPGWVAMYHTRIEFSQIIVGNHAEQCNGRFHFYVLNNSSSVQQYCESLIQLNLTEQGPIHCYEENIIDRIKLSV